MEETRSSLVDRLREPARHEGWTTFFDLYAPLIFRIARRMGVTDDQAEDIVQQVMQVVVQRVGEFHYDRTRGRFRSWLRKITYHKVLHHRRDAAQAKAARNQYAETLESDPEDGCEIWEQEWQTQRLLTCIEEARQRVEPLTYQAFYYYAVKGWPAQKVANGLDIDIGKVYVSKSRVVRMLRRIHEELEH